MYQITEKKLIQFQHDLENREKSPATIKKYMSMVRKFSLWMGDRKLEKKTFLTFREEMSSKLSAATVNCYLSAVNAFLEFIGCGELKVSFLKVQRKAFADEHRELSKGEYMRLLSAAKEQGKKRLFLVMMTLGSTGIRISELKYITLEAVNQGKAEIRMKGKSRTILLEKRLCRKLKVYAAKEKISTGMIFKTRGGRALDRSNLHHEMKLLCKNADVNPDKVFPHNFRHLFARVFFSIEKNLAHLADVLGHSRIETTRIYVITSAETHSKILSKMCLVT